MTSIRSSNNIYKFITRNITSINNPKAKITSKRPHKKLLYQVTRVDDNDHKFVIETFNNYADALKFKTQTKIRRNTT